MNITAIVTKFTPHASPLGRAIFAEADTVLPASKIDSPLRVVHFLPQCFEESGGLVRFEENLRYSAKRLCAVWPNRFPTIESALPYAWDPTDPDREDIALADLVYGARMGNQRNGINDDDGWKYRGRGPLQATGYDMYAQLSDLCGLDLISQPELACDPRYALGIACTIWTDILHCNPLADRDDLKAVTRAVNGGLTNLDMRRAYLTALKPEFGLAA